MTTLIARDRVDGSKPDTPNGVNVANLLLGLGNLYDCVQTLGAGVSSVAAGTATLTQANAGLVLVDAAAGNVIINLPACSAAVGALYQFKRLDATANTVTINRAGGDTIDGATAITLIEALDFVEIRSDGVSAWRALNNTVVATKEVTTAGPATAYAVTPMPALNAYKAGRAYWVNFHVASGLNPTLQISGLTTPPSLVMQQADGTYINAVGIPINHRSLVTLLSATQALVVTMPPPTASALPGYLFGCTLSTAGASATMSVSAGRATDSTGVQSMALSALAKTTAAWAVGTAAGGLDTGAIANNTWYRFYAIRRPDTGVVDVVFSLNASTPALPAGYTQFRQLGSRKTNATAQWGKFFQRGNTFIEDATSLDADALAPTTRTPVTTNTPLGVVTEGIYNVTTGATAGIYLLLNSLATSDEVPSSTNHMVAGGAAYLQGAQVRIFTNTLSQIGVRADTANPYRLRTVGYQDLRGTDA